MSCKAVRNRAITKSGTTYYISCWVCYTIEKSDVVRAGDRVLCKKCQGILDKFNEETKGMDEVKDKAHRQWNTHGVPKVVQMKLMRDAKRGISRKRSRKSVFPRGKVYTYKDLVALDPNDVQSVVEVVSDWTPPPRTFYLDLRRSTGAGGGGGGNGEPAPLGNILAPGEIQPLVFPSFWGGFLEVSHSPNGDPFAPPPRQIPRIEPIALPQYVVKNTLNLRDWNIAGEMEYRKVPLARNFTSEPAKKRVFCKPVPKVAQTIENQAEFKFAVPKLLAKRGKSTGKATYLPSEGASGAPVDYYIFPLSSAEMTCFGVEQQRSTVIKKRSSKSVKGKDEGKSDAVVKLVEAMAQNNRAM